MKNNEQFFLSNFNPHYNLRFPKGDNPTAIYLIIKVKKQYKIPLGVKILPSHWNKKNSRATISSFYTNLDNKNNQIVNQKILEYNNKYFELIQYLCNHEECIDNPRPIINQIFGMKKEVKEKLSATLTKALLKQKMKESSFIIFKQQLDSFIKWCDTMHTDITKDDVDYDLVCEYVSYMRSQKVSHKILGTEVYIDDNTVKNKLTALNTLFSYADIKIPNLVKIKKTLKGEKQEEKQVYLSNDEIERITKLTLAKAHDRTRDLFLFQLSIAQRWSDVNKILGIDLRPLIKDRTITTRQIKTNNIVTYPLDDLAISILEKYNYVLPKKGSQEVNREIKEICKMADITENCECCEIRNGEPFNYTVPKYMLVSTHTARRSFISNAIKEGMNVELISKISGHKSAAAFERYNRVSQSDAAQEYLKKKASVSSGNTPTIVSNPSNEQVIVNGILEAQKVLIYLGYDAIDVLDVTDTERLWRMIALKEEEILKRIDGADYHVLKDIFNDGTLSFKEKVETLKSLMK